MGQEQADTKTNLEYRIASIHPQGHDYALSDWLNTDKRTSAKFDVENFHHAIPALRALTTQKYDLIILELNLAPGSPGDTHDQGEFDDDPKIKEIMTTGSNSTNPDYWKLGLYVIERTRAQGPNQSTPIFVFSVYEPKADLDFFGDQRIDELAIAAGANKFYSMIMRMEKLSYELIRQLESAKN